MSRDNFPNPLSAKVYDLVAESLGTRFPQRAKNPSLPILAKARYKTI